MVNKMSSFCGDFLDLDDYEMEIGLCFDKGTVVVADFIRQAWERRPSTMD